MKNLASTKTMKRKAFVFSKAETQKQLLGTAEPLTNLSGQGGDFWSNIRRLFNVGEAVIDELACAINT